MSQHPANEASMTVERVADGPSPFDRFAREYDEWFTGGGRLVFATDHSISPRTHYDSYRWALDVYRQHAAY